ncbi:MAG: ABC transporter ATP-binding protein [Firmicutes bacterium]|nr:ABC transporter ATP-binding protein [Bacillota bacterium]
MLEVKNLLVRYGDITIVDNVSFSVEENQWMMLVGPNGAGKSTIVSAISQSVPYQGQVFFEGQDIAAWKPVHLAKNIGVLSQQHYVSYAFRVEDVVRLGRYAYGAGLFSAGDDAEDRRMVEEALEMTGVKPMRRQTVTTLSGGELQRVFLAQVFAQNPRLLILDEPTNHLDLVYQKQVFGLIRDWARQPGKAVLSVVHDLNLVKAYGSDAVLIHLGKCVAKGETAQVLSRRHLQDVYGMDVYQWMNDLLCQWRE